MVDASQGVAGPSAASTLARYGADVIKVEPPAGDWLRAKGFNAERMGTFVTSVNIGKRCIAVDLKNPAGAEIMWSLLERADVFIESFRPGVIDRLGFGHDAVAQKFPAMVYTSISGFGQTGPWREKGGVDVVMQAFSGLMNINRGAVDGLPHRIGFWLIDIVTGLYAVQAMLAAIMDQRVNGRGAHIDCSLLRSAIALQGIPILQHSLGVAGTDALSASPTGTFRAADGWINFAVSKDSQWPPFCRAIGREDLAADASLAHASQRIARNAEIITIVAEIIARESCAYWQDRLDGAGILNELVNDYERLLQHPQLEAADAVSWIDQPGLGTIAMTNPPGLPPLEGSSPKTKAPLLGEDSRDILGELGYDAQAVDELVKAGIIAVPERGVWAKN